MKDFTEVKGFCQFTGYGGNVRIDIIGDYDYIDFDVNYAIDPRIPDTFGGFSGGGLWHVILDYDADGHIHPQEYHLSGVAFYETPTHNALRSLRCHGITSIYKRVVDFLRNNHT